MARETILTYICVTRTIIPYNIVFMDDDFRGGFKSEVWLFVADETNIIVMLQWVLVKADMEETLFLWCKLFTCFWRNLFQHISISQGNFLKTIGINCNSRVSHFLVSVWIRKKLLGHIMRKEGMENLKLTWKQYVIYLMRSKRIKKKLFTLSF